MLEKVAGNSAVEKLRIIMLFKADFNNNNKWLSQVVMQNAECLEEVASKQYSSQKGKAVGMQCLNKKLFYDFMCAMHKPAALCSNDAKSCYDCIMLIIAALCFAAWGSTSRSNAEHDLDFGPTLTSCLVGIWQFGSEP